MKVALLLTGFTRSHVHNFDSIKRCILDKYSTDVYFATWNKTQSKVGSELLVSDNKKIIDLYSDVIKEYSIVDLDAYLKYKSKIKFIDRDTDVFKVNQRAIDHGSFWVERLRDQWYLVNIAEKLIRGKYDVVIRLRFDTKLNNFELLDKEFVIPSPHPLNPYTDHMAYGDQAIMRKYCSLHHHIEELYTKYNVDISFAELMLKFYMEDFGDKINAYIDNNIDYEIIK